MMDPEEDGIPPILERCGTLHAGEDGVPTHPEEDGVPPIRKRMGHPIYRRGWNTHPGEDGIPSHPAEDGVPGSVELTGKGSAKPNREWRSEVWEG